MSRKFNKEKVLFILCGALVLTFWLIYLLYIHAMSTNKAVLTDEPVAPQKVSKIESMHDIARKHKIVYIRWQDIYWGDLKDLANSVMFFKHTIRYEINRNNHLPTGEEALKDAVGELRQALRSFEKKYNIKVVWHQSSHVPDVTEQFINFFDKGIGQ